MPPKRKVFDPPESSDEDESAYEEEPARESSLFVAASPPAKRPRGRPPRTPLPEPKVSEPQIAAPRLEVRIPKKEVPIVIPEDFVKNKEDMEEQDVKHAEMTSWILVTARSTTRVEIGLGQNMRYFIVYPSILRIVSKFFRTHFNQQAQANHLDAPTPNQPRLPAPNDPLTPLAQAEQSVSKPESSKIAANQSRILLPDLANMLEQRRQKSSLPSQKTPEVPKPDTQPPLITVPAPSRPQLLTQIEPLAFAIFWAWSIDAQISQQDIDKISAHTIRALSITDIKPSLTKLWFLGETLGSPGFQNRILHILHTSDRMQRGNWPYPAEVRYMESQRGGARSCKLYELAVMCVAVSEPLKNPKAQKSWDPLLDSKSPILTEALRTDTKRFANVKPWHKNYLKEWLVKEAKL